MEGGNQKPPEFIQEPFDLLDLEQELVQLYSANLAQVLFQNQKDIKDPQSFEFIAKTIKVHPEHMVLSKYGQLFLVASCIYEELDPQYSIFFNDDRS